MALAPAGCAGHVERGDEIVTGGGLRIRLDAAIDRALEHHRIVGAVIRVAHHGEPIYSRAAGLADRERRVPMQEDSIFLLASVTKPIVTVGAMRLIEAGQMSLDDPVTRWLPHFTPLLSNGRVPTIRVRHL